MADLEAGGYLEKTEDYQNSVGACQRCHTVIEPLLSDQWYVAVKKLAEPSIRAITEGHIKFVPERWNKVYLNWMTNLHDWCISRQLWWGHQVPAYYCDCGEIIVAEEMPKSCPKCKGKKITQDPDVFDTWFSSCLWPFSTLGWPEESADLKTFYPTSVLVTGYDIITFWVSRMIMMGLHFMKKEPFGVVNIHGLIRDAQGRKMSKSLGNSVDPLEKIDQIGADALRFALVNLSTGGGQDIKLTQEKMTECRNFCTKLWNVSRFVLMNWDAVADLISAGQSSGGKHSEELVDQWIETKMNLTVEKVTALLNEFEYGAASTELYNFIWSDFCDWYIEIAKIRLQGESLAAKKQVLSVLINVLQNILKLSHPFMPFITEEIWSLLKEREIVSDKSRTIMLEDWPKNHAAHKEGKQSVEFFETVIQEIVRSVRNIRSTLNVPPGSQIELILAAKEPVAGKIAEVEQYLKTLARVKELQILPEVKDKPKQSAVALAGGVEIYVPLAGLIDIDKEISRLNKEKEKMASSLAQIKGRIDNPQFVQSAKPEVVARQQQEAERIAGELTIITERIKQLS